MLDQITKATANSIEMSLAELQTLASPTFLFAFENRASGVAVTCIAADTSSYPTRYNKFTITEQASPTALNGEVELEPVGLFDVRVYEQTSTTNLSEALADNLLARDKVRVVINGDREATAFTIYDNPDDTYSFWDVDASEGIVVTPPTRDVTYENSNDSFSVVIPSGTTYVAADITWTDSDLSVNTAPANTDITCTPAACVGNAYSRPLLTGQDTSYVSDDDGNNLANGVYDYGNNTGILTALDKAATNPFLTLIANNSFGNLNRFTDDLGTQIYTSGYVIDHLTGLGWKDTQEGTANWTTSITNATAETFNGFSDYRLPNLNELLSVKWQDVGQGLVYTPFIISPATEFWVSTTDFSLTTFARVVNSTVGLSGRRAKTDVKRSLFCRTHFA